MALPFIKMHGLGNDFIVVDGRRDSFVPDHERIRRMADRRFGIGCDQFVLIEPSSHADAYMRIFNADGGEVEACGNATRCVAMLAMEEAGRDNARIDTAAGLLTAERLPDGLIEIDMGKPGLLWHEIPLSQEVDTLSLPIDYEGLAAPCAVSMGNPHMVFFVKNVAEIPLESAGAELEYHPLYPEQANVGVAQILSPTHIHLRVWERGVGETLACGTGACAALVAAVRRGLNAGRATVSVPGGDLVIRWQEGGHVRMCGPAARVFEGVWLEK